MRCGLQDKMLLDEGSLPDDGSLRVDEMWLAKMCTFTFYLSPEERGILPEEKGSERREGRLF